jgi:hypothetical protein
MSRLLRGVVGISVFLLTTACGFLIGVFTAFWYTYFFLDEDRTGNADVNTNIFFLGIAFCLGVLRLIGGAVAGRRPLIWAFSTRLKAESDTRAASVMGVR